MQHLKRRLSVILILLTVPLVNRAQTINGGLCCPTNTYWEAGINLGVAGYTGHIDTENPDAIANPWHNQPDLAVGGFLQFHVNQYLGVEAELFSTRLSGKWNTDYPLPPEYQTSTIPPPPPTFETGVTRYSLSLVGYFSRLFVPKLDNPRLDAYLKAGVGQITLNTLEFIEWIGPSDNHRKMVYPFAAGAQWHLTNYWNIGLEAQWNLVNTDRLDGLHDRQYDPNTGAVERIYYDAMEHFGAVTVNISYRFGNKQFWKY